MNKQSITKYAVAIVLGLGVVLGVSSLQAAWTTPAGSPPGNNVDAPINVGTNSQSKLGQLFVNTDANTPFTTGFQVFGKSIFNGTVQIVATGATGKVLTSDATGNASWQTPTVGTTPSRTYSYHVYATFTNGVATVTIPPLQGGDVLIAGTLKYVGAAQLPTTDGYTLIGSFGDQNAYVEVLSPTSVKIQLLDNSLSPYTGADAFSTKEVYLILHTRSGP